MQTFLSRISTMKSWPTLVVFFSSNHQCLISTGSPVYNKNERRKPTFQCVYDWNLGFSSERIIRGESSVRVSECANLQSRGSCVHNLHIKWRSDCKKKVFWMHLWILLRPGRVNIKKKEEFHLPRAHVTHRSMFEFGALNAYLEIKFSTPF